MRLDNVEKDCASISEGHTLITPSGFLVQDFKDCKDLSLIPK